MTTAPTETTVRKTDTRARAADSSAPGPIDLLWEATPDGSADLRGRGMPAELERRYGGSLLVPLRPDRPTILANFVETLDGIVALGGGDLAGGGPISGFHEPDRFVMGLLRAIADVVVVGAGTLRGSNAHQWTPGHVHPRSAAAFADWRTAMGLAPNPTTVFVTGSGDIPVRHPGLTDPAVPVVILTTDAGRERLAGQPLAGHVRLEVIDTTSSISGDDVGALAARLGARLVLTEGGPHLLGRLIEADVLDEVFLTLAPQVVGRAGDGRLGLVEGVSIAPEDSRWQDLVSVRRSGDHLMMRYRRGFGRDEPRR